jgi:hypothetical protein
MSLAWEAIQRVYDPDPGAHVAAARSLGLDCPAEVFEALFHDHHKDAELGTTVRFVGWAKVIWEEGALSGVALRHAGVPRAFQPAVDEARRETEVSGFHDDRPEVMEHWAEFHTWTEPPIVLSGELLQSNLRYELIVDFTRLGNLLGAWIVRTSRNISATASGLAAVWEVPARSASDHRGNTSGCSSTCFPHCRGGSCPLASPHSQTNFKSLAPAVWSEWRSKIQCSANTGTESLGECPIKR